LQNFVRDGEKLDSKEFDYKLVGVVIHMGVADAGHYISYVNIEREADSSSENRE
jgi:ubiquitin C-terminal hydrolase